MANRRSTPMGVATAHQHDVAQHRLFRRLHSGFQAGQVESLHASHQRAAQYTAKRCCGRSTPERRESPRPCNRVSKPAIVHL